MVILQGISTYQVVQVLLMLKLQIVGVIGAHHQTSGIPGIASSQFLVVGLSCSFLPWQNQVDFSREIFIFYFFQRMLSTYKMFGRGRCMWGAIEKSLHHRIVGVGGSQNSGKNFTPRNFSNTAQILAYIASQLMCQWKYKKRRSMLINLKLYLLR